MSFSRTDIECFFFRKKLVIDLTKDDPESNGAECCGETSASEKCFGFTCHGRTVYFTRPVDVAAEEETDLNNFWWMLNCRDSNVVPLSIAAKLIDSPTMSWLSLFHCLANAEDKKRIASWMLEFTDNTVRRELDPSANKTDFVKFVLFLWDEVSPCHTKISAPCLLSFAYVRHPEILPLLLERGVPITYRFLHCLLLEGKADVFHSLAARFPDRVREALHWKRYGPSLLSTVIGSEKPSLRENDDPTYPLEHRMIDLGCRLTTDDVIKLFQSESSLLWLHKALAAGGLDPSAWICKYNFTVFDVALAWKHTATADLERLLTAGCMTTFLLFKDPSLQNNGVVQEEKARDLQRWRYIAAFDVPAAPIGWLETVNEYALRLRDGLSQLLGNFFPDDLRSLIMQHLRPTWDTRVAL